MRSTKKWDANAARASHECAGHWAVLLRVVECRMSAGERHPHVTGSGPGTMTPDGCPVELWARLPAGDIPALLVSVLPSRCSTLDLGAGAGRLTHPLTAAGHRVTAVDESADMLSHVHNAETICSRIEDQRLDHTFDAVLLASHLVNVPDEAQRLRLLATCRHHVKDDGVLLLQRFTPNWARLAGGRTDLGAGISQDLTITPTRGTESSLVSVVATYTMDGSRWDQAYVTHPLDDRDLSSDLDRAGLHLDRWISDDGTWVAARPVR